MINLIFNDSDEEGALKGTWVTLKIMKALQLGYVIQETYEIWNMVLGDKAQ